MPMFIANVLTTLGFVFFLSFMNPYIIGGIVDMVGAGGIRADEVIPTFGRPSWRSSS